MVEVGKANIRIPVKIIKCAPGSFRYKTLSVPKGIKALFCCPAKKFQRSAYRTTRRGGKQKGKCEGGMKIVTVLYSANKWTLRDAKAHAKARFKR